MALLYDPKALTESLELDYVGRPRALHRWQRRCTLAAGGAALIYVAWAVWPTNRDALQAGPVATPHAMFNQDCGKCHTEAFATAMRLAPGDHRGVSTPDRACLQCHPGPAHNALVAAEHCTDCHMEHHGDSLLARPGDRHCTACHAELDLKYGKSTPPLENVASFAAHPEFALWRAKVAADPGTVEFSHLKHLQLRVQDKLAASEAAVRRLEQLQCTYCHQPDAAGKYMEPIDFDKHCQDCHPLLLLLKADKVPEGLKPAVLTFLKDPAPHPQKGQTAWHVRAAVRERFLRFAQNNAAILKLVSAPPNEWMTLPGLASRGAPATKDQVAWVNEQWAQAETLLFDKSAGCARCHAETSTKDRRVDGLPDFGQPKIPNRWLQASVFDHKAHRMLSCTSCHDGALTSSTSKDVLIPKLASCQACHQAKPASARADCVECHLFHRSAEGTAWHGAVTNKEIMREGRQP